MLNNKQVSYLSLGIIGLSYLFAAVAVPFILIAGVGLLVAVPFIFIAYKEYGEVLPLIKKNKPIRTALRRKRAFRVFACFMGMSIVLGLIWWANSGGVENNAMASFFKNMLWVLLISLLLLSPQLLYRKK